MSQNGTDVIGFTLAVVGAMAALGLLLFAHVYSEVVPKTMFRGLFGKVANVERRKALRSRLGGAVTDSLKAYTVLRWQLRSLTTVLAALFAVICALPIVAAIVPSISGTLLKSAILFCWAVALLSMCTTQLLVLARTPPHMGLRPRLFVLAGFFGTTLVLVALLYGLTLQSLPTSSIPDGQWLKLVPATLLSTTGAWMLLSLLSTSLFAYWARPGSFDEEDDWDQTYEPIVRSWEAPVVPPAIRLGRWVSTSLRMTLNFRFAFTLFATVVSIAIMTGLDISQARSVGERTIWLIGSATVLLLVLLVQLVGNLAAPKMMLEFTEYWKTTSRPEFGKSARWMLLVDFAVMIAIAIVLGARTWTDTATTSLVGAGLVAGVHAIGTTLAGITVNAWLGTQWFLNLFRYGVVLCSVCAGWPMLQLASRTFSSPAVPIVLEVGAILLTAFAAYRLIPERSPSSAQKSARRIVLTTVDAAAVRKIREAAIGQYFTLEEFVAILMRPLPSKWEGESDPWDDHERARALTMLTELVDKKVVKAVIGFDLYYWYDKRFWSPDPPQVDGQASC